MYTALVHTAPQVVPQSGWIVNLDDTARTEQVLRAQLPIFYFDDGEACFEVWMFHKPLQRWFCMTALPHDPRAQYVTFFSPHDVPDRLRQLMKELGDTRFA